MSFGPIQMLNVCVDPSTVVFLTDDGLQGQTPPGEPGSSGGGLDSGGTLDPRTGRYVRNGGSGTRYQTTKTLPHAVNDSLTTSVGSSFSDVNVLANDTYVGTPSIIILDYPVNGTARVVGTGAASRIRYTPPATGDQVGDTVRYRLRATGNARGSGVFSGPDTAQLFVNVTVDTDPHVGTYTGTLTNIATGLDNEYDVRLFVTMDSWDGGGPVTGISIRVNTGGFSTSPFPGVDISMNDTTTDYYGSPPTPGMSFTLTLSSVSGGVFEGFAVFS